ncbi:MAG: HU family DNA-binding protein [Bacteroidales bacterium]|nr:HU family DNA-binding protein [Bacteroidales bacterium]MCF8345486.1 HU family DNA-binding protein [Bacteroidales bacterium]MCF8350633.1 HU family DNA-binding protein [Bacteroidales bacterium]
MAVKFYAIEKGEPGVVGGGTKKWYASLRAAGTLDLSDLATDVADNTTVSETDAYAVLKALEKQIPKQLSRGFSVKLGDFGRFRLSISSNGHDTEEEVSASSIKKSRILFSPGSKIKNALKLIDFVKAN